jgi:alpha-L-rhamnosidase
MKKIISLSFLIFICSSAWAQVILQNLKVENQSNPVGLGTSKPRFSWVLSSKQRNIKQIAYEIQVKEGNKIIWNSNKVNSDASVWVEYQGSPLQSTRKYTWQVRVWDNQGKTSAWANAGFQTALLNESDWRATWINSGLPSDTVNGVVPMLRKSFTNPKKIKSAIAYITARGLYEARINGQRIGDAYLSPGWTSYNKHLQFQTYDVTNLLVQGKNSIGVLLGSGWYRTRLAWENAKNHYGKETALLFQLVMEYTDGSTELIVSDQTWKTSLSEIRFSEIYDGEIIDNQLVTKNWTNPDFDDSAWKNVISKDFPKSNLIAAINEPIRKKEAFKPIKIMTAPNGKTVLDFGQNLVGWVKMKARGQAGTKIVLSHIEMLDKKGNPYFENLRSAKAQATYVLRGEGEEVFEPHFTFFGFRYVQVEGLRGNINPEDFTAIALYSDMPLTGNFECSNPLLNQLQKNIQWGQRGNFLDVPTDCPQRDERLGWTGDAQVFSKTAAFNFDVHNFFVKWLKDVIADQEDNGSVPFVIPNVLKGGNTFTGPPIGAAGWSDASIIIPWNLYVVYGDKQILENQYESMKKYLGYMQNASKNDLWNTGFQFADWLSYKTDDSKEAFEAKSSFTDVHLVAQAYYAHSCDLMIKTAKVLGKTADVEAFKNLQKRVKDAFVKEYVTPNGRLISETQTAYVLALEFELLPENLRVSAVERLVANIKKYKNHLTTGFLGTPHLCHVLSKFGRPEVAYDLLLQETYPSWLYPVKMGATTIWERWDSMKPDSTFQDPGMTSFNHYAYGAVGDWMYKNITGINPIEEAPGYKQFIIRPLIGGKLNSAQASLQSNYGLIRSAWKIESQQWRWEIEIPANATAKVYFANYQSDKITESGKPISNNPSFKILQDEKGNYLELGSGKYTFISGN